MKPWTSVPSLLLNFVSSTGASLNLRQERVVLFRQARRLSFLRGEDFIGTIRRARAHNDVPALRSHRRRSPCVARRRPASGAPPAVGHAHELLRAVVFDDDEDRFAIGRPTRLDNIAIQVPASALSPAPPARRNDRERMHGVFDLLRIAAVNVGDRFAVRTPGRRAFPVGSQSASGEVVSWRSFAPGFAADQANIPIFGAIRIVAALGDKRDFLSVRRPGRQNVVVRSRS